MFASFCITKNKRGFGTLYSPLSCHVIVKVKVKKHIYSILFSAEIQKLRVEQLNSTSHIEGNKNNLNIILTWRKCMTLIRFYAHLIIPGTVLGFVSSYLSLILYRYFFFTSRCIPHTYGRARRGNLGTEFSETHSFTTFC